MGNILDTVESMATEHSLPKELVIEVVKDSMIRMAKREINENSNFTVYEDLESKDLKLSQKMIVCSDDDFNENIEFTHIPFKEAIKLVDNVNIGDELEYQISLDSIGRTAVDNFLKDITHHIQNLHDKETLKKIEKDLNKIVNGRITHIDDNHNVYVDVNENIAVMPKSYCIKGEKLRIGQPIKAILKKINITQRGGIKIELSRTTPKLLEELLKLEVPEIKDGEVVIHKISRIPGIKAKVALYTNNSKIDPIGSAVGTKGVRINAISKELNGESIDCIEYSSKLEIFVAKSLLPAQVISVKIDKKNLTQEGDKPAAFVQILRSQKSKAIGRNGTNIRLANMLTGFNIQLNEVEDKDRSSSDKIEGKEDKKLGLEALESLFKGNKN